WKCFLDSVDPTLWPRFSIINTFNFYDLGNTFLLDNYEKGVKAELKNNNLDDFQCEAIDKIISERKKSMAALPQKIKELKKYYGIKDEQ
ncbi:MAG: hypothetical protein JW915_06840, partial [Chitinispirillaceae bacterium]|nr:hypothetical protein [Chitinispirillaceae bacterium]